MSRTDGYLSHLVFRGGLTELLSEGTIEEATETAQHAAPLREGCVGWFVTSPLDGSVVAEGVP